MNEIQSIYPALIYIVLVLIGIGIVMAKNGERKVERYSFGFSILSEAFLAALLYWGGFFDSILKAL